MKTIIYAVFCMSSLGDLLSIHPARKSRTQIDLQEKARNEKGLLPNWAKHAGVKKATFD